MIYSIVIPYSSCIECQYIEIVLASTIDQPDQSIHERQKLALFLVITEQPIIKTCQQNIPSAVFLLFTFFTHIKFLGHWIRLPSVVACTKLPEELYSLVNYA
jgi:hypothetical protein